MRLLLLLAILAVFPQAARAASFDCQRAETVVEKTICGDAKLSALDDREVAAYAAAATTLDIGDTPDFRDPVADLLSQGHKAWTAERDRCGAAANCLLAQYLRRLAVLEFRPDARAATPLDRLIGRYGTSILPERELVVMRGTADSVLVHVAVGSGAAACSFNGIGRLAGAGRLLVTHKDFDGSRQGDSAVGLAPTRLGLEVTSAKRGDDVSAKFCGPGGALEQPFPRR